MAHLVGQAGLIDSRDGVTAADDGNSFGISDSFSDSFCAFSIIFHFKYAHRPVPDDEFHRGQFFSEEFLRLRADVEDHPSAGTSIDGNDFVIGVVLKFSSDRDINRQEQFRSLFFSLVDELFGQIDFVGFDQGFADAIALGSRKVLAMPPPMIMRSTLGRRLEMTSILSETLAPPMMAAKG